MEDIIVFNLLGNEACDEELAGDCEFCEFRIEHESYRKLNFEYCEKGFWREEP